MVDTKHVRESYIHTTPNADYLNDNVLNYFEQFLVYNSFSLLFLSDVTGWCGTTSPYRPVSLTTTGPPDSGDGASAISGSVLLTVMSIFFFIFMKMK